MMENRLASLFIIFSLLFSTHSFGKLSEVQGSSVMPIEWQAIKLQESIEDKISRSLLPIIKPEDYVIEVKIGVDTDSAEDPSSKKITKNIQRKKVQFTNAEAPKDGDDFVVFNKLGLEAPIVGEEPVEMQTSEVELAQKALIEINDRYNLFNYLSTIDINLTFDNKIPAKTKESINKIVNGLSFNTKDIVPQINIQYIDLKSVKMTSDPTKVEGSGAGGAGGDKAQKEHSPSLFDRFKNLDIMFGIILGAIILALAAIFIARKGSKHEEELKATNNNENEDNVKSEVTEESSDGEEVPPLVPDEEANLEGEDMGIDLTKTDPVTMRIVEGLERFRKMLNHHYNDMALMVKGWIKIGKGDEAEALKSLVQMLSDAELTEVFKCLTIDERSTWKMCLSNELTKEELSKTFTFISNKIMQTMMVPSLIDDYELCDLLLALRAEDAAKYALKHPELGVIFANVLSSKTIGEMFKILPVDVSAEIIERSSYFRKDEIVKQMPLLKEKLLEFKEVRDRPPFVKRIFDILPTAHPELEKKLYGTLLNHLPMEDVVELATNTFPADLVEALPDSIYKESISRMPTELQTQYFISLSDEERVEQLNRFAPKGSKSRDMVEVEINSLIKNEVMVMRIRNEKRESIHKEYLNIVRTYLTEAEESKKEVSSMVENWLKNIKEDMEDSGSSRKAA